MSRIDRRGFFGMLAGIFAVPAIAAMEQDTPSRTTGYLPVEGPSYTTPGTVSYAPTTGTVTVPYAYAEYYDYNGPLIHGTYTGGVACS